MSDTPTPRTDANIQVSESDCMKDVVPADFARQLERDLAEALDGWAKQTEMYEELERENQKLQKEVAAANKGAKTSAHVNQALTKWVVETLEERDEWKACAEELAEQLALHHRFMPRHDTDKALKRYDKLKGQTK